MKGLEIFELAAKLGQVLKEDERLIALQNAKEAYENDEQLKKFITEYQVQQTALQNEAASATPDTHFIDILQARVEKLYRMITESKAYMDLDAAQAKVNALMAQVNGAIMYEITGEMPSDCTHDCSTCGGCH